MAVTDISRCVALFRPFLAAVSLLCVVGQVPGAEQKIQSDRQSLDDWFSHFCVDCHSGEQGEAGLRLDAMALGDSLPRSMATLEKVIDAVASKEMPPDGGPMLRENERTEFLQSLRERLDSIAREVARPGSRARNRRLTNVEYNHTLQQLFGVDASFADMLPPDPISADGYRNAIDRLGLSAIQVESYLDSARRATQRYVRFGTDPPDPLRYHIEFEDLFYFTADRYGTRELAPRPLSELEFKARRDANRRSLPGYVAPLTAKQPGAYSDDEAFRDAIPKLNQQYIAIPQRLAVGELIIRVRAAGTPDRFGRFPRMRVEAGITQGDGCSIDKRTVGEVDITAAMEAPGTYGFRIRLEDVPTKGPEHAENSVDQLSVFDMDQIFISNVSADPKAIFGLGRGGYADAEEAAEEIAEPLTRMSSAGVNLLHLDSIEIEMFPGPSRSDSAYRWDAATAAERSDDHSVRETFAVFMREAYRRPIAESEIAAKHQLYRELLVQGCSQQMAIRETLAAVLVSPACLFVDPTPPGPTEADLSESLAAHRLASRLSYLIWLGPPDEKLSRLANDRSLLEPEVLRREARRLLDDSRARRFCEDFCSQWLRLDKISNVAVDRQRYPEYDDDLAADFLRETVASFAEVFEAGSSALELIDSSYLVINDRLAMHYQLAPLSSGSMQRVTLPSDSVRGGLLTQGSVLTMNSDGTDSHPIRRGVWLLDRILDRPPPPPPPNVPEIDAAGADVEDLTLKERIELHRAPNSCRDCHRRIDPWGIALENFDAVGHWRDRRVDAGSPADSGNQIDASVELPQFGRFSSGHRVGGVRDLKQFLIEHHSEVFADALTHHLLTYALGRAPDYADRTAVSEIEARFEASGYQIKSLLLAIVESPLFRQ